MPSRVIDTMPSTMKLTMTIVAKTGRLMEVSEIHMMPLTGAVATDALARADCDGIARTFVPAAIGLPRVGDDRVAGGEAARRSARACRRSGLR